MADNMWDKISKGYSEAVGDDGDTYHKTYTNPQIFKLLGKIKGKRVLDLACGQGYFSELLKKRGGKIVGVDYSRKFIEIAKKRKSEVEFRVGSSSNMSFLKKNSFDYIVCNFGLHDIKDLKGTIKECSRVIKKGGKFVWVIPHPAFYLNKKVKRNGGYFKEIHGYKKLNTKTINWFEAPFTQYHRPIEYYFNELFKGGFLISGFKEITTRHRDGKVIKDKAVLKYKSEFPSFLVCECVKK
jgi:ubiquinone/menaquinone biosynthesis C-methylase UbiE